MLFAGRMFSTPVFWLAKIIYRYIILPAYRLNMTLRKQWKKSVGPAKNRILYPLTAKPVAHIVVAVLIFTVTAANLHASTLPPSTGENSILFTLISGDENDLIEETAGQTRTGASSSYFGAAYGVSAQQAVFASASVANTDHIALLTNGGSAVAMAPVMPGAERTAQRTRKVRTDVEIYTVQSGDTISTIAAAFGLQQNTILWANDMGARDYIRPGQKLKILPIDGITYTVKKGDTISKLSKTYSVSEEDIRETNNIEEGEALAISQELLIPGGKVIYTAPTTTIARAPVIDRIIDAISKPVASPESDSASMIWPTSGHVITQYWGWQHTGVDIDGHYDSPIYASDAGVVEIAGWGTGYGVQSVINHENGYKTRYAHMSKIFVTPGQRVNKGEVIGMVGTTGRSTGTHLHFEVYVNGKRANPLLYVR